MKNLLTGVFSVLFIVIYTCDKKDWESEKNKEIKLPADTTKPGNSNSAITVCKSSQQ
jgi:hypothetical protein